MVGYHKQLLKDIVCMESYTPDKAAVDAVGALATVL